MATDADAAVKLEDVTRRFGAVTALADVCLKIKEGEFFSLLGPSGCGKTTLLRIVAGLEWPDAGMVCIGGAESTRTPAHQRPVNTVFQSYALFPHLDVWHNVAFGLSMRNVPRPEIRRRVEAVCELVRLETLYERRPHQLSGGQKQRVALARAIVNEPKVLLLDEPMAALDVQLRKELQGELRRLQRRLGMTFIYVTHDQEEAMVLSDRLAVMEQGRIAQIGSPAELYDRPRTRFVSQFMGSCNVLEATAAAESEYVQTALGKMRLSQTPPGSEKLTLAIRPEKIRLWPEGALENVASATVEEITFAGAQTHYVLNAGDVALRVEAMNMEAAHQRLSVGEQIRVQLPAEALILLDD